MTHQNTSSLFSRVLIITLAVLAGIVVFTLAIAILKALFGLLVFVAIVAGLVWLFNKLRS